MKTEINITNGSGWNNYRALSELTALPVGTRGLMQVNGIRLLDIQPADSERPYGIAARYFDADGGEVFCQLFDQNDSAEWIRERVHAALSTGIKKIITERAREIHRTAWKNKITAWRRNWDAESPASNSGKKLRAKFGALRASTGKMSRKGCWILTRAVIAGELSFADAVKKFN